VRLRGLQSVRQKLVAIVLATTFVALVVALGAMIAYDLRSYHRGVFADMATQAELLANSSDAALSFDDSKVAAEDLAALKFQPQVAAAAIYNARGRLFATYARPAAQGAGFPKLPDADNIRVEGGELVAFKRVLKNGEILGTVYLRADYGLYRRLTDYLGIAAIVLLGGLLLALITTAWLQRLVTGPILGIAQVAREVVEQRDYSRRAVKMSSDEVGALVESFNDMLAEIERRTRELETSGAEVLRLNSELERRVQQRTAELEHANRELESFSYSVSHDLRSPLRAIDGYSQILQEDYGEGLDDEGRRLLRVVRDSAQHMARLIDDLLSFSQLGRKPLAVSPLDMAKLATEVVAELSQLHPNARIELGPLPPVSGDRSLLRQVWINLVSNALKYSAQRERPYVEIGGREDEGEKVFWVRDNGAGFDMRYKDKLFKVFQRLHRADEFEGTGVGLAIVQRVVTRHGGRVWAESGIGEGAVFRFALPKEH
jgi:signal transduction histidine kinase